MQYMHSIFPFLAAASDHLAPDDQASVELWLSLISILLLVTIFGLIVFAYSIRFIARNRTRPCPWCTEFIPKTDTTCPRCGKAVEQLPNARGAA